MGGGNEIIPILLAFGLAGGIVGRIKGSSFVMWFLVSFCVPFIGLACAVLYRYENRELRRQCPNCQRVIGLADAVCVACGAELDFPDTAIASEMHMRTRPRVSDPAHPAA
jgi:hypothetical protein